MTRIIQEVDAKGKCLEFDKDEYDFIILRLAFAIVDTYPDIANKLIEKLHTNWGTILDLRENIAVSIAKDNLCKAFDYLNKIDVEYYKASFIKKIISQTKNTHDLQKIIDKTLSMESNTLKYGVLYEINKKFDVGFSEDIYDIAKNIYPYNNLNFDNEIVLSNQY